jgi:hypothetical protein
MKLKDKLMKHTILFGYLLLLFLLSNCRKESDENIEEVTEDCFMLSDLRTRTNHLLPFKLYHDVDSGLKGLILNSQELDLNFGHILDFQESGFYELILVYSEGILDNDTIHFTLISEERLAAEWGISEWTPAPFTSTRLLNPEIQCISPNAYYQGIEVPFIFFIREEDSIRPVYSQCECTQSSKQFNIKRGIGSVSVAEDLIDDLLVFNIGGNVFEASIHENVTIPLELTGEVTSNISLPANSIVKISADLHIPAEYTLTVGSGTLIMVDEGINISNEGPIIFEGSQEYPILVTCSDKEKYWGGFISNGSGAQIEAEYTFFCRSGYHHDGEYSGWGHAGCQALFYTYQSILNLQNCYILDNAGQIFYPTESELEFQSIIVQRAKTGGQINYCTAQMRDCIFTDFPDDTRIYMDNDNDAIYINASDVTIDRCTFMYAKDDGMDSGLNEGGTVTVNDSRFEACFHEGAALSSQNQVVKNHIFNHCTFYNCGQGLELGFSSPNHTVVADGCTFIQNGIGIRYGDNYEGSVIGGYMHIKNSQSIFNEKDVWNMVRMQWSPRIDHLDFENTQVTTFVPQYPDLEIIGNSND